MHKKSDVVHIEGTWRKVPVSLAAIQTQTRAGAAPLTGRHGAAPAVEGTMAPWRFRACRVPVAVNLLSCFLRQSTAGLSPAHKTPSRVREPRHRQRAEPPFRSHLFHSGDHSLLMPVAMSGKGLDVRAPDRSGRPLWEMLSEKGKEAEMWKSTMKCSQLCQALPALSFY